MQMLVMSDTHRDSGVIDKVRGYYPNADVLVHCGDSELAFSHPALEGMQKVEGNCDFDRAFPEEAVFEVGGTKIFVTHGHLFNVKMSLTSLNYRARELGAQIACFGHSHFLGAEMIGGILFLNPGSLLMPRGRKEKSFALVDITDDYFQVDFLTDANDLISTHQFARQ
ncbi:metallophosphoesterase [Lysinibacillus piscis]|uniref:Phosphoesterase n=1 Tax=Lysinibacillus piscis TaxID=2518931 RepID=A0ABQ5NJ32_9BACI|nr:metallophosphoesterase [Lysinibacillus sp. KH24]GLC88376.1 phosphoesterase [Lysinibacillus sp. KH24]